jgi:hypothetical protein
MVPRSCLEGVWDAGEKGARAVGVAKLGNLTIILGATAA